MASALIPSCFAVCFCFIFFYLELSVITNMITFLARLRKKHSIHRYKKNPGNVLKSVLKLAYLFSCNRFVFRTVFSLSCALALSLSLPIFLCLFVNFNIASSKQSHVQKKILLNILITRSEPLVRLMRPEEIALLDIF